MTNQPRVGIGVLLFSLLAASAVASDRLTVLQAEESLGSVAQRSALIAHVRVAGDVEFGGSRAHFVEILDEVRGPSAGQLAFVSFDLSPGSSQYDPPKRKPGEQYILFADRDDNGMYRALPATCRAEDTVKLRALLPLHLPATAASAVGHLRDECRRREVRLTVEINDRDVRSYKPHAPLRVEISIHNIGLEDLRFENRIDYEFRHRHFIDREQLKRLRDDSALRAVKLFVQPLGLRRELSLRDEMRRLSELITIPSGQRASTTYDLSEEYDIQGGGRFLVWAELGGHRSTPVQLDLPEAEEAIEMMAKMAELERDNGGPFQNVKRATPTTHTMPDVGATLAGDTIAAALAFWFRDQHSDDEIVILRTMNLPDDFAPNIAGILLAQSDVQWRSDGKPSALETSRGKATFRWRVLRINSVEMQGNEATVEIIENDRHNLGGSGATLPLRRVRGQWQIAGEVQLWQR